MEDDSDEGDDAFSFRRCSQRPRPIRPPTVAEQLRQREPPPPPPPSQRPSVDFYSKYYISCIFSNTPGVNISLYNFPFQVSSSTSGRGESSQQQAAGNSTQPDRSSGEEAEGVHSLLQNVLLPEFDIRCHETFVDVSISTVKEKNYVCFFSLKKNMCESYRWFIVTACSITGTTTSSCSDSVRVLSAG